jgi:hypothetical protein
MRTGLLMLALLVALGCGSDNSSAPPPDLTCSTVAVPLCQNPTTAQAVTTAATDAVTRLLPSLSQAAQVSLGPSINGLSDAVEAGDITEARAHLVALDSAILALRVGHLAPLDPDVPTLDALGVTLLRASEAVGGPVTSYP